MSFPRYERYKDSGVEWLGDVPEHWDRTKLRRIAVRYSGGTPDKTKLEYWDDGTIPWLSSGEVNQSLITQPSTFITEEAFKNSSAKWIPSGALVMALAGQGKTKGTVAQLAIPSTCNQSMAAIVPRKMSQARFLFWWLSANYQNIRNMAGGDLRDGLNLELLGDIDCPLVPEAERLKIARVLDQETAKIDALIEEQRRLIELLKEKRQSVISHAVTKGLNLSVAMKASGVDWIGSIPQQWEVAKLGQIASIVRGGSPRPAGDSRFFNGDFTPWITVGEVTKDDGMYLVATESMLTQEGAALSRTIDSGTLVLTNSGATLGVPKILGITGCANDGILAFLNLDASANKKYLYFVLGSLTSELRERMKQGSGQPNLNTGIVGAINVPLPPVVEQLAIVTELERMQDEYGALMEQTGTSMTLLQERRSAFISAAVTGKIDVRNYTPKEIA